MLELIQAGSAQPLVNKLATAWDNLLTKKDSCTEKLKDTILQILESEKPAQAPVLKTEEV